ncbi:hypothetical protein BDR03DRAFT_1015279 [Suillus americanus]|nr:hypothetical protein BDR03DRAFT_1015279 [Suillus americanus]
MSYPTSVTAVPTTTSPTTSASRTTTSTSSLSSVSSSNAPTSTVTTPIATSTTSVATAIPTTITSQQSYGSSTVVTTEISTTTPVAVPTPSPVNNSSSNTGAIVGGVVGGVVVIIVLLGLFFFYLRRRRRRNESDGNLGPDHIVSHPSGGRTQPQVDLGEENEITPLPYPDPESSMRQYGEPLLPAGAAPTGIHSSTSPLGSPSQYSDTATSPGEGYPSQGFIRPGPGQYPQGGPNTYAMQRPLTSPPRVSNTSASSSGHGMKERETAATAGRQGLVLPTQQEVDSQGSGAVQHQDAGQAPSEGGELGDVPPAYESIGQ